MSGQAGWVERHFERSFRKKAVIHDWIYIPATLGRGRAGLMKSRGWDVGEPVYLPHADYKWVHPCSKPRPS